MYSDSEETQCTHCDHLKVCSLKEQFMAAQNAVDRVTVGLGDRTIKNLKDFDWIKRVKLECKHFSAKRPTPRDISAKNQARGVAIYASEALEGKFMEDPT